MPIFLCATCGTSFAESPAQPARCSICEDERQYVPDGGQRWIRQADLARGHSNAWRRLEPELFELRTHPAFAIGQRAFLIRTPRGNVLWDCIALLDDATRALIDALGGVAAIAISHPHYYTTMQDWAVAFDAPVHLHARDREWVMRPDNRLVFWNEDEHRLGDGLTLLRLGGHFSGGTVLHWRDGEGGGALMVGDILQVAPNRKTVSFLWSYPNWMPLSGASVARIAARLEGFDFGRVYGAFGHNILEDGKGAVMRSAGRYAELLRQNQP